MTAVDDGCMTEVLNVTILSAPVAAVDRRALSQAWYSALHLTQAARTDERAFPPQARPGGQEADAASHGIASCVKSAAPHAARATAAKATARTPVMGAAERRAARSRLSRKIERALLHPQRPARRSMLTVDGSKARVAVTLQETTQGLRLVAMCAPHSRAAVARALEEARYALASRGILLRHALAGDARDR